jgi:membrane protease YdiL (CAAX protease family)
MAGGEGPMNVIRRSAGSAAGSLLLVVVAFLCGLYWSALRAISRSLVPSLCAHLAWDVALIVFPLVRT